MKLLNIGKKDMVSGIAKRRKKRRSKRLSRMKRSDWFTVLSLVLFFPLGLTRMWMNSCKWNHGIKYAVSGVCVALVAAIMIVPSPYKKIRGGVEIVAQDPEVEVYGPSAPQAMVNGYTSTALDSVVTDSAALTSTAVTVFASEDGRCYHLGDCKFAYASAKRLSPYEAYYLGYKACKNCNPPIYDPVTGKVGESVIIPAENASATEEVAEGEMVESAEAETTETSVM